MILKASQRGGPRQLAEHLQNQKDNDHVTLAELRGFVSDDLYGAMAETVGVAKGTKCRQPVFSLSMSPPKDATVSREDFFEAADRAERALGLEGQPRAVVIHEKQGRMHAHVVWSRIDPEAMKAVNLPHFKNRLNALSKELFLEHGWELPEGHKTNGWKSPLNFTLAEWQQAKRLGLDPREIKQVFQTAYAQADNLASFKNALEENGYFLAQGDRRGVVAIDINGEVFSVPRMTGAKSRDVGQKLKGFEALPGVEAVKQDAKDRLGKTLRKHLEKDKEDKRKELQPLKDTLARMVNAQRLERAQLDKKQQHRHDAETKARAEKFRRGLGAVMDVLTGRWFHIKKENEKEAYACHVRDRQQRETLVIAQMDERKALQAQLDSKQQRQRQERMRLARQISRVVNHSGEHSHSPALKRSHGISRGFNRQ